MIIGFCLYWMLIGSIAFFVCFMAQTFFNSFFGTSPDGIVKTVETVTVTNDDGSKTTTTTTVETNIDGTTTTVVEETVD